MNKMRASLNFREVPGQPENYILVGEATRELAREALRALPADSYITFFDASDPVSGGDRGTYFSMRRFGGGWQITGGNHGWSHGVAQITPVEAERFLAFCLPSNRGPRPDCIGYVKDSLPPHWEAKWSGAALAKRVRRIAGDGENG